jgi:hypothetical protein
MRRIKEAMIRLRPSDPGCTLRRTETKRSTNVSGASAPVDTPKTGPNGLDRVSIAKGAA